MSWGAARWLGPHLLLSIAVFALAVQGLGYRALWQDEVETAERARTVLESGLPRVIDRSGELSVNWGGHELDQGTVHRYNTWGQFYFSALGLALGRAAGANRDAAVRAPFVAAHAATAGLVSLGLSTFTGSSLPLSLAAGAAVALQTPRLLHNRTARYHALLDVLAVLALVALGAWRHRYKWGPAAFATALFALPHVHVFGGSVLGVGLAVLALYVSISRPDTGWPTRIRDAAVYIVAPGMFSLALVVLLVRPWKYAAMGAGLTIDASNLFSFRTVGNLRHLGYAGAAIVIGFVVLVFQRRWRATAALGAAISAIVIAIEILDLNALTQSWAMRYYLATPLLALFWPIALGLDQLKHSARRTLIVATCTVALIPELPSAIGGAPFEPFWGVRLVLSDRDHAAAGHKQPLHHGIEMIRQRAHPSDAVAVDYVPQFVPWYLPGHPTALVPDPVGRHTANQGNRVWGRPMHFPRWHLKYTDWPNGTWFCAPRCDYRSSGDLTRGNYQLTSKTLGRTETFCIHGSWPTNPWNNAPNENYRRAALNPEGRVRGALVLGGPCPASAYRPDSS